MIETIFLLKNCKKINRCCVSKKESIFNLGKLKNRSKKFQKNLFFALTQKIMQNKLSYFHVKTGKCIVSALYWKSMCFVWRFSCLCRNIFCSVQCTVGQKKEENNCEEFIAFWMNSTVGKLDWCCQWLW